MAFITKEDFTSHIYEEGIKKISRGDESKLEDALDVGMQVAARSLQRYDVELIFSAQGTERRKFAELITYIKDIAKWHFISVANTQCDLELAKTRYDDAIKELGKIKVGEIIPEWPVPIQIDLLTNSRSGGRLKFNYE